MTFHLLRWILFGLSGLLLAACSPSDPSLALVTETASPRVGQTFTVALQAEHVSDLTAFEAHLVFDASLLEVVYIEAGDFLQADFIVQNDFDNSAGTLDYAIAQIGASAAQGSGVLLKVTFRAIGAGDAVIGFRATPAAPEGALLADSDGAAIQVALRQAKVKIVP